jgi:hypothetical protein
MGADMAVQVTNRDIMEGAVFWAKHICKEVGIPDWAVEFEFEMAPDRLRFQRSVRMRVRCLVDSAGIDDLVVTQLFDEDLFSRNCNLQELVMDELTAIILDKVKPHLIMVGFCVRAAIRKEEING